ncbi:MAG TPA: GNAT family N-acetyltransferase [Blastocatellia bacterium]|nr:GNAT family N-acetyltransferase [Blastocatellia bacterium]
MSEFEIREATADDRGHVIRLMGNIYPGDVAAHYDWLYRDNPHGRPLTWLAIESATGEAVGCTSIFPRRVMVAGRERLGSIGGDCYIEPRVRRRGLATRMHVVSFEGMRRAGIGFMYGPPTPNNLGALVKAGSRLVTSYRRWVRPLTSHGAYQSAFSRVPTRIEARLAGLPILMLDQLTKSDARGFTVGEVFEFGDEFNSLFAAAAPTHPVVCVRDRRYLAWRYRSGNQKALAVRRDGELVGFTTIEKSGHEAAIMDIFCPNDARLTDALLRLVIEYATAWGCTRLQLCMTEGCAMARRLLRHGFIAREERGFQVAVGETDEQAATLLAPTSWHLTEADQDLESIFV